MTIRETIRRIRFRLNGNIIHLLTEQPLMGAVLISYFTHPFLLDNGRDVTGHTNYWEVMRMADEFLERGYDVDVIDATNTSFIPRKNYLFFIDIHANLERLAPLLNPACVKILFTTTSHWQFNNSAEYGRLKDVFLRRGEEFLPERLLTPTESLKYADFVFLLGNDFTESTYAVDPSKVRRIPLSTTFTYETLEKNYLEAQKGFVWIGGAGLIHKGLDLLVEAFGSLPKYRLELCGKHKHKQFERIYKNELGNGNITGHGHVVLDSEKFTEMRARNAFVISTSCAEGQSGSVIIGMHAGLIPIVSRECGVDTADFGFTLPDCSIETIKKTIEMCAALTPEELKRRSDFARAYAQKNHTRETFCTAFKSALNSIAK